MMNHEAYAEWLVKREIPSYAPLARVGAVLLVAVAGFAALNMLAGPFGVLLIAAAVGAAWFVFSGMNVEYEYLFVNGQLTIDKITAKSKRKNMAEYDMADLAAAGPLNSDKIRDYERQIKKTEDYTSGKKDAPKYALIYQKGSQCTRVLIEPNDKMLHCFKMAAPSKVVDRL